MKINKKINKKILYITEPDEIYLNGERKLLEKAGYKIIYGDKNLNLNFKPEIESLLVRSYTKLDAKTLNKLPNLKNVVRVGVGMDHIDTEYCNSKGIKLYNSAGANANAVSEFVIYQILNVLRKMHLFDDNDLSSWDRFKYLGSELSEKTIGLVGFGNIARILHKKLSAFDCKKFMVYDPYINPANYKFENVEFCSLSKVLSTSDIISLHLPLTKETHHLINNNNLKILKSGAVLINTSRGGIVCEKEIVKYVKSQNIFYISDVFENEPKVEKSLLNLKNFVGTPHIAAMTSEANKKMTAVAIANFIEDKRLFN